jgi:hypothetical protein
METRILVWIPEVNDILMAVIGLACRGGEELRVPRIYSALCELKGRDMLLSGLYFSITGAVCYSRQIEESLRSLIAKGVLIRKGQGTLVVRGDTAEEIRAHLKKRLPSTVYRALKTASKRFYGKMFKTDRAAGSVGDGVPGPA